MATVCENSLEELSVVNLVREKILEKVRYQQEGPGWARVDYARCTGT